MRAGLRCSTPEEKIERSADQQGLRRRSEQGRQRIQLAPREGRRECDARAVDDLQSGDIEFRTGLADFRFARRPPLQPHAPWLAFRESIAFAQRLRLESLTLGI